MIWNDLLFNLSDGCLAKWLDSWFSHDALLDCNFGINLWLVWRNRYLTSQMEDDKHLERLRARQRSPQKKNMASSSASAGGKAAGQGESFWVPLMWLSAGAGNGVFDQRGIGRREKALVAVGDLSRICWNGERRSTGSNGSAKKIGNDSE
jgi:hypothetical protein